MINLECEVCGHSFEGEVPWDDCPRCEEQASDAARQRPPIDSPKILEIKIGAPQWTLALWLDESGKVVGFGGTPAATVWLKEIRARLKAYESELADYGRTMKRLNGEVEQLRKDLDDRDGLIRKIEREARYRGR